MVVSGRRGRGGGAHCIKISNLWRRQPEPRGFELLCTRIGNGASEGVGIWGIGRQMGSGGRSALMLDLRNPCRGGAMPIRMGRRHSALKWRTGLQGGWGARRPSGQGSRGGGWPRSEALYRAGRRYAWRNLRLGRCIYRPNFISWVSHLAFVGRLRDWWPNFSSCFLLRAL